MSDSAGSLYNPAMKEEKEMSDKPEKLVIIAGGTLVTEILSATNVVTY